MKNFLIFLFLGRRQFANGVPAFTHSKEGSYGIGERIQYFGQFDQSDISLFERGDYFASIYNIDQPDGKIFGQISLSCNLQKIDQFENGLNRPLTQEQYFEHFLDCEVPMGDLTHEHMYALSLSFYDDDFDAVFIGRTSFVEFGNMIIFQSRTLYSLF